MIVFVESPKIMRVEQGEFESQFVFFANGKIEGVDCIVFWQPYKEFIETYNSCGCDFCDDEFACDWQRPIKIKSKSSKDFDLKDVKIVF